MMRILPVAVLILFATVAGADDEAGRKFLKELEGTYAPVSMTKGGEKASDELLKAVVSITFKGDSLTVRLKGEKEEDHQGTLVVDLTQKPIAIDMIPKDGPDAGKPMLGIIKVDRDAVTICWADRGDATSRPKEFSSTKENKQFLIVMKKK